MAYKRIENHKPNWILQYDSTNIILVPLVKYYFKLM